MKRRDLLKLISTTPLVASCGGGGGVNTSAAELPTAAPNPEPALPQAAELTQTLPKAGFEPQSFDFPVVTDLPFAHGVASGDPLSDRVIIWTRLTLLNEPSEGVLVKWRVCSDVNLTTTIRQGTQVAMADRDWTIKVDAQGLQPATTYYYQFETGAYKSMVGRTRTAPAQAVDSVRAAVVACSSYWSSTWSGYKAIAQRDDLDLVIHCGDYIYDFVDEDEQIRARKGIASTAYVDYRDWLNLAECRRRYALYRSDPNLLAAHQQHPWFITWDNHDIDPGFGNELPTELPAGVESNCTLADTTRAFWEWTPSRPVKADGSGEFLFFTEDQYPEPENTQLVYRTLPYGPLASFRAVDTQILLPDYGLEADSSHLPEGAPTLFGKTQFDWLVDGLRQDQADGVTWKVINNQTWIAPWVVPNLVGDPLVGLPVRWNDYAQERDKLVEALRGGNGVSTVDGAVFVSGDMHGNWASDLVESTNTALTAQYLSGPPVISTMGGAMPENPAAGVQRAVTGNLPGVNNRQASVAVEFAPSSMGRGGADELIANAAPGTPFALQVAGSRAVEQATLTGNKHVQFMEWVEHGYGIVHLEPSRAVFECWWQNKLQADSPDVLGAQLVSFAVDAPTSLPVPQFKNQIDVVQAHGMLPAATVGSRTSPLAPEAEVRPR